MTIVYLFPYFIDEEIINVTAADGSFKNTEKMV